MFLKGSFKKDIAVLLLVTILVGTVLSAGIAFAADSYFGNALSGLIGEYGEYDIIVQTRQDMSKAARQVINEIAASRLGGARVKTGLSVAGKANVFISLPKSHRRQDVMETLGGVFSSVPGYAGYSVIMEPRISVRGLQPGSTAFFKSKFSGLNGVAFSFMNEGGIDVVLSSPDDARTVSKSIQDILSKYKVVEARLPIGYQVKDISSLGSTVAQRVKDDMAAEVAIDISMGESDKDLLHFINTLGEMKRFLLGYATEVRLDNSEGSLIPGDIVALVPEGVEVQEGTPLESNVVVARVLDIGKSETTAVIVRGDSAPLLKGSDSFKADVRVMRVLVPADKLGGDSVPSGSTVGAPVGSGSVWAQRKELSYTIEQSISLLVQLQKATLEADKSLSDLNGVLSRYEEVLGQVSRVSKAVSGATGAVNSSVTQLEELRSTEFRQSINESAQLVDLLTNQLNKAKNDEAQMAALYATAKRNRQAVDNEIVKTPAEQQDQKKRLAALRQDMLTLENQALERYERAKNFTASAIPIMNDLSQWRRGIPSLLLDFARLDSVLKQRSGVKVGLENLLGSATQAVQRLESIDISSIREDVKMATRRLSAIKVVDTQAIIRQLEHVEASLPQLNDEDIGRSINLIDKYMQGQVIPGERVMILTNRSVPDSFIGDMVRRNTSVGKVYLVSSSVGLIQPNIRGEVSRLLGEVRGTISALAAMAFTLFVLVSDHAILVSLSRVMRRYKATGTFSNTYGAVIGCLVLFVVSLLSGARIPYLGFWPMPLIGFIIGGWVSRVSEKVSPVTVSEVIGAESLGMSTSDILRQVVIPSGRPGLMGLLNKRHVIFD